MFDTYRKKLLGLLVGTVLFFVIAYWLSFSKTLEARAKYDTGQQRLASAVGVEEEIGRYSELLKGISGGDRRKGFTQENLFERVGEFCETNNLAIRQMPEAEIIPQDNYQVITNLIELKGGYTQIVQLVYQLEQEWKYGKVVSTSFEKVRNRESREMELAAKIYLQNIEPIRE